MRKGIADSGQCAVIFLKITDTAALALLQDNGGKAAVKMLTKDFFAGIFSYPFSSLVIGSYEISLVGGDDSRGNIVEYLFVEDR